ncbi:chondroadherin-like protein [Caerostris darwini]|uniref:Chondroadherin-like protein n=1 Tax=Caerostris darwini TaxID=1538125 RepID=A0AAV4WJF6_9ARAC|nr:chondroadherin-like protein [Caerostris darwini]
MRALLLLLMCALARPCAPECVFLRDEQTIRCKNSTLPDIADSLHVLIAVAGNRPLVLDVEGCRGRAPLLLQPLPLERGVEEIRVRDCGLEEVAEGAFEKVAGTLKRLDLSKNLLESVPEALAPLRTLRHLNLSHNRIARVQADGPLSRIPGIRDLNLAHNSIGEAIEGGLPTQLRNLDLRANRISTLSFRAFSPSTQRIDVRDNPLRCDCTLLGLIERLNRTEVLLPPCAQPQHLQGRAPDEVPWRTECPEDTVRYMDTGNSDVVHVKPRSPTSLAVSWRSRDASGWTVVYRREEDSPYQMTLAPHDHRPGDITLEGLQPRTAYVVCLAHVSQSRYTVEVGRCATARTPGAPAHTWTELEEVGAAAQSVSISWRLRAQGLLDDVSYRHEWTVRLRRKGAQYFTEVPVYDITKGAETDGQRYEYALGDLAPRTWYQVCLVDVEHGALEGKGEAAAPANASAPVCEEALTLGQPTLQGAEIAAVVFACALCIAVCVVTIVLCHQKKLLKCKQPVVTPPETPPPRPEAPPLRKFRDNGFGGSWSALSRSLDTAPRPQFRSFRTLGYRDALTSVTIYSSGYSEC